MRLPTLLLLAGTVSATTPAAAHDGAEWVVRLDDPVAAWKHLDALVGDDAVVTGRPAETPWVGDAGGSVPLTIESPGLVIRGRAPGPRGALVGYSTEWLPEATSAAAQAADSAAEQLRAVLWRELVFAKRPERRVEPGTLRLDFEELDARLVRGVRRELDRLIVDRFEQRLERPYATLYRAAVLVRADEQALDRLASAVRREIRAAERDARLADRRNVWTGVTAGGFALVTILFYLLFNAGTKGYFVWPLRLVSLFVLALAVLGLLYFRGWA
jgi:hypothetical protein